MRVFFKLLGLSVCSFGAMAGLNSVSAAESVGRAGYNVAQLNRAGVTTSTSSQRMPTMPTLPGNSVGNLSPNLPTTPSKPVDPDNPVDPEKPACPDGGVENSEYTVDMCMNDLMTCINNGALPGGLNDMFDADVRNSIVNGMGLCIPQVERCIKEVRQDCQNVYRSSADVWIDFNARKVQPEYYNFVLRKTGLTPNQAENTCWLLDKNTYGTSFNAVSNQGGVTSEYNKTVGAYNSQQGNVLVKNNPQGVTVNNGNPGVDGQRGHYARWDARNAECLIRVGAYNKNDQITNSWLFGAVGNDKPAEVWKKTGDTFTCNKDLFGFSLMNQTNTAAVVGVGGGTLLGAGIGALAGHGDRAFDCNNDTQLSKLSEALSKTGSASTLNQFLTTEKLPVNGAKLTVAQCNAVVDLFKVYLEMEPEVAACENMMQAGGEFTTTIEYEEDIEIIVPKGADETIVKQAIESCAGQDADVQACVTNTLNQTMCLFKPIKNARPGSIRGTVDDNVNFNLLASQMSQLRTVFERNLAILAGEKSNMAASVGIGAGVGAGAGGLATAITAFVERSNINCRVGDGLEQVGYGKSYSIGSLKDFYVKWNLRLPDTVAPTGTAVDCDSWRKACGTLTDLNQCANAQINYKSPKAKTTTLVRSACAVSGSACIENYPVAKSYGACK